MHKSHLTEYQKRLDKLEQFLSTQTKDDIIKGLESVEPIGPSINSFLRQIIDHRQKI